MPSDSPNAALGFRSESTGPRRLKILVVDDEASVRTVIAAYLKKHHEVHTANSGVDGLAQFRAGTWDLVLSDGKLGDMSGLDLAAAIKETHPKTAVILVTGSDYFLPKLTDQPSPFDGVLEKPFGSEALYAAIAAVCGQ